MNHTYLLVWNKKQIRYMPAPETARRCGKSAGMRALSAAVIASLAVTAHALPGGGQIAAGQGSIAQTGSAMKVTQQSQNLAINWQNFGIRSSESVVFAQPNASAIALNRVLGSDTSQILGNLSSNGQVWILNPNGVLFGSGAQINVGGLLASTLSISDADFLAGKRTFAGEGGTVTNQGSITAADGGYVGLLGSRVSNEGVIQARLGTVALAAGKQVTLDFAGDKLLKLQVDKGAVDALVQNKQLIQADGGNVLLTSRAADAVLSGVVNNEGIIEAHTIDTRNGTIKLLGSMIGGTVKVGGVLDASAPGGGDGGYIETSGAQVKVSDSARVTTAASTGRTGLWLIDPTSFTVAGGDGDITGNALAGQLANSNVTVRTHDGARDSGDIKVKDNVSWSSANSLTLSALDSVKVYKAINNSGVGDVTLRADNAGACVAGAAKCGTVTFRHRGHLSVNGGAVNIYYNPAGSNNAADADGNGPSYATPTDFSGKVTLNGGSKLSAWMLVNDVNQLQAMNTNFGGSYALSRDVDASATASWNGADGFMPIGHFTGRFDGANHAINGLVINRPAYDSGTGLFGSTEKNAVIQNVALTNVNVEAGENVGALVGHNFGFINNSSSSGTVKGGDFAVGGLVANNSGAISNSHSSAIVSPRNYYGFAYGNGLGGLVGYNSGKIWNSYSTGSVSGSSAVGGLVAVNTGEVWNSYNSGDVSGRYSVGGLVGVNRDNGGIENSYSTGTVTGGTYVGGLAGLNILGGNIWNSYSTGAVSGTNAGGLVGFSDHQPGTVENSYWDTTTSGQMSSAGGTPLGTGQMDPASYTNFDFAKTWWMSEGNTRPFLRSEWSTTITNAHQLQLMAMNLGANYTLARDIDMSELVRASGMWNTATGFLPVGKYAPNGQYTGIFDGANHSINGLMIKRPAYDSGTGLFGSTEKNAAIQNVALTNVNVEAGENVGALVGHNFGFINNSSSSGTVKGGDFGVGGLVANNSGTISNSHSSAIVSPRNYYGFVYGNGLGGLVGYNNGEIWNSYSTGSVSGSSAVGGLVAVNTGGVWNSYNTGDVSGRYSVGGLVGVNRDNGGIENSYSTGTVTGGTYVGGLAGLNILGGSIRNTSSTGSVSGTNAGGLVGFSDYQPGTVENSYWDTTTSGQMNSAGGTPLTSVEMKQKNMSTGIDFINTLGFDGSNSGYPIVLAR